MVKEVSVMLSAYNIGGGEFWGFASVLVMAVAVVLVELVRRRNKKN